MKFIKRNLKEFKMFKKSICYFALWGFAANVFAIPFQSNRCNEKNSKVKHPNGSQAVLFDEECNTAYVLPPSEGKASIAAIATTSNLNLCPAVNSIPSSHSRQVKMI